MWTGTRSERPSVRLCGSLARPSLLPEVVLAPMQQLSLSQRDNSVNVKSPACALAFKLNQTRPDSSQALVLCFEVAHVSGVHCVLQFVRQTVIEQPEAASSTSVSTRRSSARVVVEQMSRLCARPFTANFISIESKRSARAPIQSNPISDAYDEDGLHFV